MLNLSLNHPLALALLYGLLSIALGTTSAAHYLFGHYNALLIYLIATSACAFASLYLYVMREPGVIFYVNQGTLLILAVLTQYLLAFQPELGQYWLYAFPILCYFTLPLGFASWLNGFMLITTCWQLSQATPFNEIVRQGLLYTMIAGTSWCYAYLNGLKYRSLLKLAVTDNQSGAYNSRHLAKMLAQEIARSKVTKRTLSLIAITIEDYIQVLDIHGQTPTEKLLHFFRNKLMGQLRAGDEAFHDGEGTFYLLLPNCPMEGAVVLKERLQNELSKTQWQDIGELQLSTGIVTLNDNEDGESFLLRASQHVKKQQQTALRLMAFS